MHRHFAKFVDQPDGVADAIRVREQGGQGSWSDWTMLYVSESGLFEETFREAVFPQAGQFLRAHAPELIRRWIVGWRHGHRSYHRKHGTHGVPEAFACPHSPVMPFDKKIWYKNM
jgi:hypothetical protein